MKQPAASRLLDLLAALSRVTDLSVGCYCENEARCHRTALQELLEERGGQIERAGSWPPGSDARTRAKGRRP
jgi:uncharacterized protein (DUF488 family)